MVFAELLLEREGRYVCDAPARRSPKRSVPLATEWRRVVLRRGPLGPRMVGELAAGGGAQVAGRR